MFERKDYLFDFSTKQPRKYCHEKRNSAFKNIRFIHSAKALYAHWMGAKKEPFRITLPTTSKIYMFILEY